MQARYKVSRLVAVEAGSALPTLRHTFPGWCNRNTIGGPNLCRRSTKNNKPCLNRRTDHQFNYM